MTCSTLLRPLVFLLLAGCTVLQDVDEFETDRGCDLVLPLQEFGAHANDFTRDDIDVRHEFFIEVIRERDVGGVLRDFRETLVYFDPLPDPDMTIQIPEAVPPATRFFDGRPRLEFWADQGRDGPDRPTGFNPADESTDHSWEIRSACAGEPFLHRTNTFVDLSVTRDGEGDDERRTRGTNLRVNFVTTRDRARAELLMRHMEVRVLSSLVENGVEVVRPIAFARRGAVAEPPSPALGSVDSSLSLEGVFDEGFSQATVIISFDGDGDGEFVVGSDSVIERTFSGESFPRPCAISPRNAEVCGDQNEGVLLGFEVRVVVEIDEDGNLVIEDAVTEPNEEVLSQLAPWWRAQ